MKNILLIILLFISFGAFSQVEGRFMTLRVNQDPNTIIGLQDQNGKFDAWTLIQTTTNPPTYWKFNPNLADGSRWYIDTEQTAENTAKLANDLFFSSPQLLTLDAKLARDTIADIVLLGDSRTELSPTPSALIRLIGEQRPLNGFSFNMARSAGVTSSPFSFMSDPTFSGSVQDYSEREITDPVNFSNFGTNGLAALFFSGNSYSINSTADTLSHYTKVVLYYRRTSSPTQVTVTIDGQDYIKNLTEQDNANDFTVDTIQVTNLPLVAHNFSVSCQSGGVAFYEISFEKQLTKGVNFHALGNSNLEPEEQARLKNSYFFDSRDVDLTFYYMGVNGFRNNNMQQTADSLISVVNYFKDFSYGNVVVGERDNSLNDDRGNDTYPAIFNELVQTYCAQNGVNFVDLSLYIKDWEQFREIYGDGDIIHEGPNGATYVAKTILKTLDDIPAFDITNDALTKTYERLLNFTSNRTSDVFQGSELIDFDNLREGSYSVEVFLDYEVNDVNEDFEYFFATQNIVDSLSGYVFVDGPNVKTSWKDTIQLAVTQPDSSHFAILRGKLTTNGNGGLELFYRSNGTNIIRLNIGSYLIAVRRETIDK